LPLVSVITVSWNRKKDVSELVESLLEQTYERKEIIVVDNASADGTVEFLHTNFPNIRVIALKRNYGLHGGFNIGAAKAKGDIIIGVDHDCVLDDVHAIDKVVKCFTENPKLGIVAFKVENYSSREVSWDNPLHLPDGDSQRGYPCIAYNGCGFAVLKDIYDKVGGLDEQFFVYVGELDLTLRVINVGYECGYFPDIVVLHKSSIPPTSTWYKKIVYRNWVWFVFKNFPFKDFVKFTLSRFRTLLYAIHSPSFSTSLSLFYDVAFSALSGLPQIIRKRKPISPKAYDYYKTIMTKGIR
jgi:hypothetical protein